MMLGRVTGSLAVVAHEDDHFRDPQSPWQRATNENTNGLLRSTFRKAPTSPGTAQMTSPPSPPP